MATLIKGILSFNLDWQFVLVGVFIAVTLELCGIKSLSFAVGTYLPLSTTLPIFIGGAVKGLVEMREKRKGIVVAAEDEDLGKGNLFATGLVAGGALFGVLVAVLTVFFEPSMLRINLEERITHQTGELIYFLIGVAFFAVMAYTLYKIAIGKRNV